MRGNAKYKTMYLQNSFPLRSSEIFKFIRNIHIVFKYLLDNKLLSRKRVCRTSHV